MSAMLRAHAAVARKPIPGNTGTADAVGVVGPGVVRQQTPFAVVALRN